MKTYHITKDGLLMQAGSVPDGVELSVPDGCELHDGFPVQFDPASAPFPGARWSVKSLQWVDTRSNREKVDDSQREVATKRRSAYPPLEDLADALYWQSKGDPSKMTDYLNKIDAVKKRLPKL